MTSLLDLPLPLVRPATPGRRRSRKTLHFDAQVFAAMLDACVALELQRLREGRRLRFDGQELLCIEGQVLLNPAPWTAEFLGQHLRAILKAFLDAARPASGLALRADGLPQQLPALIAAGQRLSLGGSCVPKLERNIKAGAAVDRRLAEAALSFFRIFLERPQLRLDEIGAGESERVQATRRLEGEMRQTREHLPSVALEGMLAKAHETAAYAWVLSDYVREYRQLRLFSDERGLPRIALERVTRFKPLKLVTFEREFLPCFYYEWYEWARYVSASLTLRLLDGPAPVEWPIALHKRLDARSDLVVFEPTAEQPAALRQVLRQLALATPGEQPRCEFECREQMVLNAADRDLLVSYYPITQAQVIFDTAAAADFHFNVGDSPGLLRDDQAGAGGARSWRLQRALLPREVLAVRIRWAGLGPQDALSASPSGEIVGALARRPPPRP